MSQDLKAEVLRLKEQVAELSRVKDHIEICKLQSRYAHLYFMLRNSEIPSLFAQKTPGVSIDIEDAGIYKGMKGVKRFWTTVLSEGRYRSVPGWLAVHMTVNPIIEINKDGTKAKGVWFSHGSVSGQRGGKLDCMWCLGKYDMEYVKEDGEWKFFKLAYRISYMCPVGSNWVEEPITGSIAGLPENTPDKPATNYLPYSRYRINIFPPPPPEPYKD
jgi:hypothetical protein